MRLLPAGDPATFEVARHLIAEYAASLGVDLCFQGLGRELEQLYIPAARGRGLGRRLMDALLDSARRLGYPRVRLDTLPGMTTAQQLYRELGFRQIEPYGPDPLPGTLCYERDL